MTAVDTGGNQPVPGQALRSNGEAGHFAFGDPGNVELTVKILNSCAVNNRYWVSATAPVDVGYTLTVTDTQTGTTRTYSNPVGRLSLAVEDTSAFATCP